MANLKFADTHNMFWSTVKAKTINGEVQLHALVDGKKIIITELTIRRDLQLEDAEDIVADEAIYKELGDSLVRAATTTSSLEAEWWSQKGRILCDEEDLGEDASKQGRRINAIYDDDEITLVNVQDDADNEIFNVDTLTGDEVFAEQEVAARGVNLTVDEVTLAQALTALKSVKPKVKGDVIKEPSVPVSVASTLIKVSAATTTTATIIFPRKGIVITELDIALKLQEEINEDERIARAEEEKINKANIAWDDIQAKDNANYQLAERLQAKEQEQFTIEEKATLIDLVEGSSKREGEELEQESTKKQKVDEDKDTIELQSLMEVILDEEEVAIDIVPLATKSPNIVGSKIHKEGKKSYYQIMRGDGKSQMYKIFSQMIKSFDKEDLEDLYKLVKARYGSTRPVEDLDLVLWNDLKTMFKPHVEDEIWKLHKRYKVLSWKLFDSYGVHYLSLQSGMIYMLVEKRYPLTPHIITDMLNKKLQVDYFSKMAYQLLKLLTNQGMILRIKSFLMLFGVTTALIDVNVAQSKLVLLENFNENYSKFNAAEGVNAASKEVSTAELVNTTYVICMRYFGKRYV
ncbi:hypothetical protein Tco_0025211 [Tanacetum coccineum]